MPRFAGVPVETEDAPPEQRPRFAGKPVENEAPGAIPASDAQRGLNPGGSPAASAGTAQPRFAGKPAALPPMKTASANLWEFITGIPDQVRGAIKDSQELHARAEAERAEIRAGKRPYPSLMDKSDPIIQEERGVGESVGIGAATPLGRLGGVGKVGGALGAGERAAAEAPKPSPEVPKINTAPTEAPKPRFEGKPVEPEVFTPSQLKAERERMQTFTPAQTKALVETTPSGTPSQVKAAIDRPVTALAKPEAPPRAEPAAPQPLPFGQPVAPEGPLNRAPALQKPRTFEDQLHQLETNAQADRIDTLHRVKDVPEGVKPETWEKLYHYEEDPKGVTLTPEERAIYDEHVAPIKEESARLYSELEKIGHPELAGLEAKPEPEGYTPRYVKGRTRSFGEVLEQWKEGVEAKFGGAAGRSMRKTVDSQKSRRFYNAVNPETGDKAVVFIGPDGKVATFDGSSEPIPFGQFKSGQKIAPGSKVTSEGQTWTLESATTKEIEAVAQTRYTKNVLANRLDQLSKLRSAVRNARFIEEMKESPDWEKVAVKVTDQAVPPTSNGRAWRVPKVLQFRGYYMEPHLADALDDFLGRARSAEGLEGALDKAGNLIKGSIFYNPLPHMKNVANHYLVEKGLVGNARDLITGSTPRTLMRAARAVSTQNEDFMRALRSGASLPYAKLITRDVHQALIAKLGEEVARNPTEWQRIASIAGYANPVAWIKALYATSSKYLWGFGDVLNVARILELQERGIPIERAIKLTEEHMPNYRVPGQVLGQRWVSQMLQNPLASMFGRYQYNRMASYMNMAKDLSRATAKGDVKLAGEMLDKLAMLGVVLMVYYPLMDKAWQTVTGNSKAKVARPGATSIPQAGIDLVNGDKDLPGAVSSVFSLGPIEAVPELYRGRYGYSGQPIARTEDLKEGRDEQFIRDLGAWVGSKIQPVGQALRMEEGSMSPSQFLLGQLGVSAPSEEQQTAKEKAKMFEKRDAARRAARLENKRAGSGQ